MFRGFWCAAVVFLLFSTTGFTGELEKRIQIYLNFAGFDVGRADGSVGPKTRRGLDGVYSAYGQKAPQKITRDVLEFVKSAYFDHRASVTGNQPYMAQQMTVADARHLLERSGLGAPVDSIEHLTQFSRSDAVREILAGYSPRTEVDLPAFVFNPFPEYWIRWDYDEPGRQAFRIARDREIAEFKLWWVRQMIASTAPQNERLALFWTGHFPVQYSSINEETMSLVKQHFMFRDYGFGNFRALTKQIIRDPAMLNYLDGDRNRKGAPNENLGRELMELFVLGEGAYDEKTVKEAARALTGHGFNRVREFEFELRPWRQDNGKKSLFGKRGNFDGDALVDILFEQPDAARFLTEKMWRYFVSEIYIDAAEIDRISDVFRASDYEIPVLLSEIFSSPLFWEEHVRATIVKSPVDLVVGTIRSTGFLPTDWQRIPSVLANLGQNLFEPPNVAGWPGAEAWVTPGNLLNRSKFLSDFFATQGQVLSELASDNPEMSLRDPETIIVRYGAENYQGPPNFRVLLLKKKDGEARAKPVWQSGTTVAKGGHDTELFGRVDNSEIPWTLATFKLDPGLSFDEVRVSFLNDHCCGPGGADGGDRNLFVEWVKVGNKLFLAQDGKQQSSCNNNNERPGWLYCSGGVVMRDGVDIMPKETTAIKPLENQLIVERVAFDGGEKFNPNDGWNTLRFALKNVRFNDYRQDGMIFSLVRADQGEILIEFSEFDCSQNCFHGAWPSSAHRARNGSRTVKISLGPNEDPSHRRHFNELSEQDKRFVSALWQAMPELLSYMQNGRSYRERRGEEVLKSWKPVLKKMETRLSKSRYVNEKKFPPLLVARDPNTKSAGMMSMAMSALSATAPLPASFETVSQARDWQFKAQTRIKSGQLSEVVLASPPIALASSAKFQDLITDPVFHLK